VFALLECIGASPRRSFAQDEEEPLVDAFDR
jgi:hypothetical protein